MKTIVEPKEHIDKVWGKQRVKEDATYRLMKYLLRVDHDGKVLLHNVVTGRLVVLDEAEAQALEKLPMAYSPELEQLVTEHYLVPEDYDEHQQVVNLREVLWRIVDDRSSKDVIHYTILPTTACNARCWYCYAKDVRFITMTEEVADDVVDFIERSCGGRPIMIRWLGGEPTLASKRIDQISERLSDRGVVFTSSITTNGYLFDEEMIIRAKNLWHTKQVNISIDGTEETYNRIKGFENVIDNPYQRMMRNAELLLEQGIDVIIRMNYDRETWMDFPDLLHEAQERFRDFERWMVHPHQINVDVPLSEQAEREDWFNQKNVELYDLARKYGNYWKTAVIPSLSFTKCSAVNKQSATILPDGKLVCCPEQLGEDQVKGSIYEGTTNQELMASWDRFADHKRCQGCSMFPYCTRMMNCSAKDRCSGKLRALKDVERVIIACYENAMNQEGRRN